MGQTWVTRVPGKRKDEDNKYLKTIMAQNFPDLMETVNLQMVAARPPLNTSTTRETTPRCITKLPKTSESKDTLKSPREKKYKMTADFSVEPGDNGTTLRKQNETNLLIRELHPVKTPQTGVMTRAERLDHHRPALWTLNKTLQAEENNTRWKSRFRRRSKKHQK